MQEIAKNKDAIPSKDERLKRYLEQRRKNREITKRYFNEMLDDLLGESKDDDRTRTQQ